MQILVYLLLGLSSFFFVVVPVSGSFVLNPLLSLIAEPHVAISIAAFFFLLNSTVKAIVFRKDINYFYVKRILPVSFVAGVAGVFALGYVPEKLLLYIIFGLSFYFLVKTLRSIFKKAAKKKNKYVLHVMSLLSGFLQGTGLGSGGSLRKMYLISEDLSLPQMHGTTSFIGVFLLLASVLVRLGTHQVTTEVLLPILYLLPIMLFSTILGKKFLKRMNKKTSNIVVVVVMLILTTMLGIKIFG